MSTAEQTPAIQSAEPVPFLAGSAHSLFRRRRVLLSAAFVGLIFFISDHGWLISRYEDYAGTSQFMETVTTQGNIVRQAVIFALGLASIFILLRRPGYRLQIHGLLALMMAALSAWAAASLLWSIDPGIAARRLIFVACIALAALAAARTLQPRELAAAALLCTTAYLAIGFMTELCLGTFRPLNPEHRLAGTLHPNLQGLNCALLVIAAAYLARDVNRSRPVLWALAIAGLIGLWLTKSRTPLFALIVAEATFWFVTAPVHKKIVAALTAIFLGCSLMLIAGDSLVDRVTHMALLGRADEEDGGALTGRVPLWEELSDSIAQRPWQGYGFSSFWTPSNIEDISDSQQWAISVAHSAYLDLTLGLGLIGVALAVAIVLTGLVRAMLLHNAMPGAGFAFIAILLIFVLVHGFTESAFANPGFVPLVALAGLAMLAFVDPKQYIVFKSAHSELPAANITAPEVTSDVIAEVPQCTS